MQSHRKEDINNETTTNTELNEEMQYLVALGVEPDSQDSFVNAEMDSDYQLNDQLLKYLTALSEDPTSLESSLLCAQVYLYQAEIEENSEAYEKVMSILSEILYQSVFIGNENAYEKVQSILSESAKHQISHYTVSFARGFIAFAMGNNHKALFNFNEAIKLNPNFAFIYLIRGCVYFTAQHYKLAIQDFEKVLQLEPNCQLAYVELGWTYYHLSEIENNYYYDQKEFFSHNMGNICFNPILLSQSISWLYQALILFPDNNEYVRAKFQQVFKNPNLDNNDIFSAIKLLPINLRIPLLKQCFIENHFIRNILLAKESIFKADIFKVINDYLKSYTSSCSHRLFSFWGLNNTKLDSDFSFTKELVFEKLPAELIHVIHQYQAETFTVDESEESSNKRRMKK